MRPLKFRAWDGTAMRYDVTGFEHGNGNEMAGVFLDGDYYCMSDTADKCFGDLHNRAVVMQFTGLLDSQGVEIFEGDVCGYPDPDDPDFIVVFDDGAWRKKYAEWDKTLPLPCLTKQDIELLGIIVYGNIHENPELLK